jgi:hypothetical protein
MADEPIIDKIKPAEPLDRPRLLEILEKVLEHATSHFEQVNYCLIGTAASMLHGVPLYAGDVDFLMKERTHVDAFSVALSSFPALTPPTLLHGGKQYYAAYNVNGIQVEASTVEGITDYVYSETLGDAPWKYQTLITVGPYRVPTIALELRLATELMRDRPDRYEPMISWMKQNGCDADLLGHAIDALRLSPEMQHSILAQVGGGAV